jgi:ubiquitin-conjugating enzyme E2 R
MYRRWKDSRGKDKEYENIIRKQVGASRSEAEKDNVVVPTTIEEYCIKHTNKPTEAESEMTDFYDDDYGDDLEEDEDEEENEEYDDDNEDSGNGES